MSEQHEYKKDREVIEAADFEPTPASYYNSPVDFPFAARDLQERNDGLWYYVRDRDGGRPIACAQEEYAEFVARAKTRWPAALDALAAAQKDATHWKTQARVMAGAADTHKADEKYWRERAKKTEGELLRELNSAFLERDALKRSLELDAQCAGEMKDDLLDAQHEVNRLKERIKHLETIVTAAQDARDDAEESWHELQRSWQAVQAAQGRQQ